MAIFRNIVFLAALAGLIAGIAMAAMQQAATVPLIFDAEVYEEAEAAALVAAPADHVDMAGTPAHEHEDEEWSPEGFARLFWSVVANVAAAIGFALLLVVGMELGGARSTWREGLFWGLAGFATFTLGPGLGLPPELPAMPAADLVARQIWWIATAAATAGGLALLFRFRTLPFAVIGILLLVGPHIIGAPQPLSHESPIPENLHHDYVVMVYVTNLIFWSVLGGLIGHFRPRFGLGDGTMAVTGRGRMAINAG